MTLPDLEQELADIVSEEIEKECIAAGLPTDRQIVSHILGHIRNFAGQVLTPEAQKDRDDFLLHYADASCTCFIRPPCPMCTHPGNPLGQNEDSSCFENDTSVLPKMGE